jgi:GAF domain-containing protein
MLRYFNQIKKLKNKLLIQFSALTLLSLILMSIMVYSIYKINAYSNSSKMALELNLNLLQMRRSEKDFMLQELTNEEFFKTGNSSCLTKFNTYFNTATLQIDSLIDRNDMGEEAYVDSLKIVREQLKTYAEAFTKIAAAYKLKGYKNWGYEGELRDAIHGIEKGSIPFDKVLMLTLRRHEKDFLLRKDLDYVSKFDNSIEEFKGSLGEENMELLPAIDIYKNGFHKVVDSEVEIGITNEKGLRQELRSAAHKVEGLLGRIENSMESYLAQVIANTYILIGSLFVLQLLIGVALANSFATSTTSSIVTIKDTISQLSEGLYPEKITTTVKDETGVASVAINNLIDRIRTAADFAGKIGAGELNIEYDSHFNNDVLAQSLQTMHVKLQSAAEENEKRNWATTGLANFGEIVRSTNSDLDYFCRNIISSLVKYLNINQGQLYIVKEKSVVEVEHLALMATYAWSKVKYNKKTIYKGDGLVGQAWIEGQTIFLTEIPSNYIAITSGLGDALPTSILIVPLKINDEILGILELASFQKFKPYEIEFVEKIGELIASTLSSVQINKRTEQLLSESQQQAEELKAQEEEMRQNTEEMQATQEELFRQKLEADAKLKSLEEELSKYKS